MKNPSFIELAKVCREIRKDVLKMALDCKGPAHLGGGLSIVEVMVVLYKTILKYQVENPTWINRDRFILSKGHGVLGFFPVLADAGYFDKATLSTFKTNGSPLIAHPVMNLDFGIESSNGSLGHGLSMGAGIALAAKIRRRNYSTFVLLGDGECNEGSIWEAAMMASQFKLDNLVAIVDWNGFQSDGISSQVIDSSRLSEKWSSFGWDVQIIDGHDLKAIFKSLSEVTLNGMPKVILAKTTKGKGISFMENNNAWHHNRLTSEMYEKALRELEIEN